jgi:UDP-N-acetylmuramoyl-tripeptide--D-alanyl-D-alanine ligase
MYLTEIAKLLQGKLTGNNKEVSSYSTDTRSLQPEQLFIAIKGEQFDGHDFLHMACDRKAAGAIISQPLTLPIPTILVGDTRLALGQLAHYHRSFYDLAIIALTGSCGKTTTKTLIANILSKMAPTLAPEKSFNNDIGVPLTLLQLNKRHKYAVIEMGANHPKEIAYLSQLTRQNVALITNVAPAHLEGFGTIDGVAKAKGEIYESLPIDGTAILNADEPFRDYWQAHLVAKQTFTFGIHNAADVTAKNIVLDEVGTASFDLIYPAGEMRVQLPLLGHHNVMNALAAVAATYVVGASAKAIQKGLAQASPVAKRLVRYQGLGGATIIDDSYNANPLSVRAALNILAHAKGERIFVFADMAELGDQEHDFHRKVGETAKDLGIDKLYAYGKLSQLTVAAFGEQGRHFENHASLIATLKQVLHANMVVLIKGSRPARMETIVEAIREN